MIITIGSQKGGVGKSTIAANLTVQSAMAGKRTLLVDADEQRSITMWSQIRHDNTEICTPWTTIQLLSRNVRTELLKMKDDYHTIIIDSGGRDTISLRASLSICDIFLIPFTPRSFDIWTIPALRELINEAKAYNENLKAYAIINRADSQGTDNDDTFSILKECDFLTCLPFTIGQRKAFSNAVSNGLGISEMKNPDRKAISEIIALHEYLYKNQSL